MKMKHALLVRSFGERERERGEGKEKKSGLFFEKKKRKNTRMLMTQSDFF